MQSSNLSSKRATIPEPEKLLDQKAAKMPETQSEAGASKKLPTTECVEVTETAVTESKVCDLGVKDIIEETQRLSIDDTK